MSIDPLFAVASRVAEESLDWLASANDSGTAAIAAIVLETELPEALRRTRDALARVAEGSIVSHGPGGPHYYASAHEAVESLWTMVALLHATGAVPADVPESLGVNISALRAGIHRERAKLLTAESPPEATTGASAAPQYVTRQQIAGFIRKGKDWLADKLNLNQAKPLAA
jgi:hypothetical protein